MIWTLVVLSGVSLMCVTLVAIVSSYALASAQARTEAAHRELRLIAESLNEDLSAQRNMAHEIAMSDTRDRQEYYLEIRKSDNSNLTSERDTYTANRGAVSSDPDDPRSEDAIVSAFDEIARESQDHIG